MTLRAYSAQTANASFNNPTPDPILYLSLRLSDLRAYLAELERLARENRGEPAEAGSPTTDPS